MNIVVADNESPVRKSLRRYLEQQDGFVVTGDVGELSGLLVIGQAYHPEIALVDWGLLGSSPQVGLSALLRVSPRTKIVVMSANPEVGKDAIIAGANAFVFKADPPDRLLEVIYDTMPPP